MRTGAAGATSGAGMDELREQWNGGRRAMIDAFAALTMMAMRAGVDEDVITDLHGRFFDGNVAMKRAVCRIFLLAELRRPMSSDE